METRGLERSFGGRRALAGLDLRVARGACLGLLGPNGAGKSTTIAILCALLPADRGEVRVLGLDPARDAEALRRRIGVVPQELALYDELTARENLVFFGRAYGLSGERLEARVSAALEDAGLADRARERVRGFSGGMKRRLNFVAALLHEPELVFLDEPTVGVDPQSRSRLFDMVGRLHARGTTLVYTTHQLGEVERLCERVVIVDHGRAVAEGSVDELRREAARRSRRGSVRGLEEVFLALTGRELRDGSEEPR